MPWLTTGNVADHIEHDLSSSAITRLLDDAEEEIIARYGAHATQTDFLLGQSEYLFTKRPISSVTSITETSGTTDTVLASNDYSVKTGGWRLKRLSNGTNPASRWSEEVTIVYVPVDDLDRRNVVGLQLIRLALQYSGLMGQSDGDHSEQAMGSYQAERERILSTLKVRRRNYA